MEKFPNSKNVEYIRGKYRGASRALDFATVLGYFSGLAFIRPDLDTATLVRTAVVVHALDAVLCRVIAGHSGRGQLRWTLAGLILGIWALGALFLLPAKRGSRE